MNKSEKSNIHKYVNAKMNVTFAGEETLCWCCHLPMYSKEDSLFFPLIIAKELWLTLCDPYGTSALAPREHISLQVNH